MTCNYSIDLSVCCIHVSVSICVSVSLCFCSVCVYMCVCLSPCLHVGVARVGGGGGGIANSVLYVSVLCVVHYTDIGNC